MSSSMRKKRMRTSPANGNIRGEGAKKRKKLRKDSKKQPPIESFLAVCSPPPPSASKRCHEVSNKLLPSPTLNDNEALFNALADRMTENVRAEGKALHGESLSFLQEHLGIEEDPPSPLQVSSALEQKAGEACFITAQTLLLFFERFTKIEAQLQSINSDIRKLVAICVTPTTNQKELMGFPSPLSADPVPSIQSYGDSHPDGIGASPSSKTQLIWSPKDILLNIPHRDAHLWTNKSKILTSLSQLMKLKVNPSSLSGFFYLPSNKDSKRLHLSFVSPSLPRTIFNARPKLNFYGIQIQRIFKQMGPQMKFHLKHPPDRSTTRPMTPTSLSQIQVPLAHSPLVSPSKRTSKPEGIQMIPLNNKNVNPPNPPTSDSELLTEAPSSPPYMDASPLPKETLITKASKTDQLITNAPLLSINGDPLLHPDPPKTRPPLGLALNGCISYEELGIEHL